MTGETRIPHNLRLAIFFLRLAVGVDIFYLAWTTLFDRTLGEDIARHSITGLYGWLTGPGNLAWIEWTLLLIGVCLILGFATRLAALAGFVIALASYWPVVFNSSFALSKLPNDALLVAIALLVLFFAKAGSYLGLDMFFHFSLRHPNNKK